MLECEYLIQIQLKMDEKVQNTLSIQVQLLFLMWNTLNITQFFRGQNLALIDYISCHMLTFDIETLQLVFMEVG